MDSFELNKVAGAVLVAGIFLMVTGIIGRALVSPEHEEKPVIVATGAEAPAAPSGGEAAPAAIEPIAPLLANANVDAGKTAARQCQTCHSLEKGGPNKVGPDLWDVIGRKRAGHEGFAYSKAMQDKGGEWDYESLNHFLQSPQGFVKGTKMTFAGIRKAETRADVIAYLRTLSDSPKPLPEAKPAEAAPAQQAPAAQQPAPAEQPAPAQQQPAAPAQNQQ